MKSQLPPSAEARFKIFDTYLPETCDPATLVLKGHLLIEEILETLIRSRCQSPSALDTFEMGFFIKSRIAQALIGDRHPNGIKLPDTIWSVIDSLNSLRNDLAHSLDSKRISLKVEKFILNAQFGKSNISPKMPQSIRLRQAICGLFGYLVCFEYIAISGKIPPRLPSSE
ncbi:MAG: hypothetical protein PHI58_00610 [Candidatus Omnitrophica bacterium]|nr:hypothetical protein [Candidatus Omnitrophota bacterium]